MMVGPARLEGHDLAGAVDMAGDKMAAELAADAQAGLEVHRPARLQVAKVRDAQGLREKVERDLAGPELRRGEAAAVHRDAVAERDRGEHTTRRHAEPPACAVRRQCLHPSRFLDEPGEHGATSGAARGVRGD
jgi:hypothetical protein